MISFISNVVDGWTNSFWNLYMLLRIVSRLIKNKL